MSATPDRLVQLSTNDPVLFDCGDKDLNSFFQEDRYPHLQELIAVTYCMYSGNDPLAMYSLSNDRIDVEDVEAKNHFLRALLKWIRIEKPSMSK